MHSCFEMKQKLKSGWFKEGKKRSNKDGRNDKPSKKQKYESRKKPSRMYERPKDADLTKPRKWNGAKWYYCSTETGGKCHGVYRKHHPRKCRTYQSKTPKSRTGRKGKLKMKKGDEDEDMDVVVSQQAIGDPSPPGDGDVLMGGYETEWHLVPWLTSVKIISVTYFLCQMDLLLQGEYTYIPKRKRWKRMNQA